MNNDVDLSKSGEDWRAVLVALVTEREKSVGIRASLATIEREWLSHLPTSSGERLIGSSP